MLEVFHSFKLFLYHILGRFDRKIEVALPDNRGRVDILKVHSKDKPLAPDVDLEQVIFYFFYYNFI